MAETCVGCGLEAPTLEGENTLRSTVGWRLTLDRRPDGTAVSEWRCPTCWQKHRASIRPPGAPPSNR